MLIKTTPQPPLPMLDGILGCRIGKLERDVLLSYMMIEQLTRCA
jgi:hypothetical protein